jgi:hypothetical protein
MLLVEKQTYNQVSFELKINISTIVRLVKRYRNSKKDIINYLAEGDIEEDTVIIEKLISINNENFLNKFLMIQGHNILFFGYRAPPK